MRVITLQQPAAGAVVALGKHIENRTWSTPYRGPIAIHAGAREMPADHPFWEFDVYRYALSQATASQRDWIDHRGVILAIAELVDVHEAASTVCCAPWGENGPWSVHWVLEDVRLLTVPLAFKGGLGLRNLDDDTALELMRRLA